MAMFFKTDRKNCPLVVPESAWKRHGINTIRPATIFLEHLLKGNNPPSYLQFSDCDTASVIAQMHGSEEERLPEERQLGSQADQLQVRGQTGGRWRSQERRRRSTGACGSFGRPPGPAADPGPNSVVFIIEPHAFLF